MYITRLILALLALSTAANANLSIECSWQKSESHAPNYFKPAVLNLEIGKQTVILSKDTFLYREYAPCWVGNFSSCAFGFDYDRNSDWKVINRTSNAMVVEAPGYYWSAQLQLTSSLSFNDIVSGSLFDLTLSGDDGDGVMFKNENFNCLAL